MKPKIAAALGLVLILLLVSMVWAKQPPKGLAVICGQVTITMGDGEVVPAVGWNMYVTTPGGSGVMVAHTTTDANGYYGMVVPAGSGYVVSQESRAGYQPDPLYYDGVRAHKTLQLDFNNYQE